MTDSMRQAASLIGVRDGDGAPEVLVIERTKDHRFLPGYVAFPGGAVDPPDGDLAARWFGEGATAARATALRELAEEVGLAVTRDGIAAAPSRHPLEPIHRSPPRSDALAEIARWIAPERVPVRFDARYYAVRMDAAPEPRADGSEAGAAWWASPSSLLAAWGRGDLLLFWPTHFTVAALAGCRDAEEVLALRIETREPVDRELEELPRSVFFQD